MIKLDRQVIEEIQSAGSAKELWKHLHAAVKLEHSTIPPYITAMVSLKPGVNDGIARLIHSIVTQEMLHLAIGANLLIALGGYPEINSKSFVPDYPGPLPMNIGKSLIVGIEAFSINLVEKVFMKIEEPEAPIAIKPPSRFTSIADKDEPGYATIGEFYDAIKNQIEKLGPSIFVVKTAPPQVVNHRWFSPDKLFAIAGPEDACRAIDVIKQEGEGTTTTPFDSPGEPAHFYRFGEIVAGREVITTSDGFAYDGAPILFDPSGVWPLRPNCKIADFPVNTQGRTRIEQFAYSYSSLLNVLHETFNGQPNKLDAAIGLMFDLRVQAVSLMQTDVGDDAGHTIGPSFEYVDVQGGMTSVSG